MSRHYIDLEDALTAIAETKGCSRDELQIDGIELDGDTLVVDAVASHR